MILLARYAIVGASPRPPGADGGAGQTQHWDVAAMKIQDPQEQESQASSDVRVTMPEGSALWSIGELKARIDGRLRVLLQRQLSAPQVLHQAMGYSVLASGKRLRPLVTLLTSLHFGDRTLRALDCACAIELVHAASLIMDDLPAMDDAALRRGQPTAHRVFGEDLAILSSVALLNLAFGVIATMDGVQDGTRAELCRLLSAAVGSNGLVGGQVMDLRMRTDGISVEDLEIVNRLKTGSLFIAAAEAGARISDAPAEMLEPVRGFALELGLAFQMADDVLDGEQHAGLTGKDTGKDAGKPTVWRLLGEADSRRLFRSHAAECRRKLALFGATQGPLGIFVERCLEQIQV
jgi:geranylgeranyl pyrophosphate synthase